MKRNDEHAFIKIERDIKDGKIPSLVLLYGKEDYLVDFYGNRLSKMYVNPAAEALDLMVIDRNYMTTSQIIDNFETMPLLSERKVVYIPRFYDAKAKLPKSFSDEMKAMDRLVEYITDLPEKSGDTNRLMVITFSKPEDDIAGKALKASPLYKAIKKVGAIYEFDSLDYGQLRGFIEKRFRAAAKSARRDIINLIIEECGYENKNIDYGLSQLDNDLKKIIAHSGNAPEILKEDVFSTIEISPEHDVFAMIEAIGSNRKNEAYRYLNNLLADKGNVFQLLSLITKQLEIMLTTCEMKDQGMTLKAIQTALKKSEKIHEYRTKKAYEAGNRFRKETLKQMLLSAYEVEYNIKSGLMPERLALEFFISSI